MMKRRGLSLAWVLMVTALAVVVVGTLVGAGFFHLSYVNRAYDDKAALALAEAAVTAALSEVTSAPNRVEAIYGSPDQPGCDVLVEVHPAWAPEGSRGVLTFSPQVAALNNILYSTNNAAYDVAVSDAQGQVIPRRCLRLIGTGYCRGSVKHLEVFFHMPPFPYAIGADGPVVSDGRLLVGALAPKDVSKLKGAPATDELVPGHLASNATGEEAIKLGPETKVSGNVKSAGGILLDPGATVLGSTQPHAGETILPRIETSRFDPAVSKQPFQALGGSVTSPNFSGMHRSAGDLQVYGDLQLDEGVLYVAGDLKVNGAIKGRGAVVASGHLTVDQAANFEGDNQVALLSGGNLTLHGQGVDRSYVQGLMYAGGAFTSSDLTLMGSLIKNGDPQATANVSNSHLIYVPEYTEMSINKKSSTSTFKGNFTTGAFIDYTKDPALQMRFNQSTINDISFWAPQDARKFYDPATDTYDASSFTIDQVETRLTINSSIHGASVETYVGNEGFLKAEASGWRKIMKRAGSPKDMADQVVALLKAAVAKYNTDYQAWKAATGGSNVPGEQLFGLDVNEFLALSAQLRILRWHEF